MPFRPVSSLLLSSLTIVNEGSSLTIVNKGSSLKIVYEWLSLTIVNETTNFIKTVVIENDRFENDHFLKRFPLKTIVFKNDRFPIHNTLYTIRCTCKHYTQYTIRTVHNTLFTLHCAQNT